MLRCGGREAGEYSVTAENRLGNSTRDWRLRLRPLPTNHQVTPPAPAPVPAPAPAPVPVPVEVASPSPIIPAQPGSKLGSPAAPSSVEVETKSCQAQAEARPRERRPESDSPRSGEDPAPPPGWSQSQYHTTVLLHYIVQYISIW